MTERDFAIQTVRRLREAGYESLWAGGCVRDQLLGLEPHDFDVATNARPDEVQSLFRRTIAVGASFGVIEVIGPKVDGAFLKIQVATFRIDGPYLTGRRPESVTFCSAREDALRRDFTINGMFFDPIANQLIDYVGGQADLQAKVLRAIGDPHDRFAEDKLRLLRAVRFAARFELSLDPTTESALRAMADQLLVVSAERIADEFRKLLVNRHRVRALRLLHQVGLLKAVVPEVDGEWTATSGDRLEHLFAVTAQIPEQATFELVASALLHEVGENGEAAAIIEEIGRRMKLSNQEIQRISWLVATLPAIVQASALPKCILKPVLHHAGAGELLTLARAHALASGTSMAEVDFAQARLQEWAQSGELNPPPLITGEDLKALGIPQGPAYKRILDAVRAGQLDDCLATKSAALEWARQMSETG